MSCIFCSIGRGQTPSFLIGENSGAVAFLDIRPHAPGHTVIIPREHVQHAADASADSWTAVFSLIRFLLPHIEKKLGAEGFNVGWNDGAVAGQAVPHWHVHILPRYSGDRGGSIHSIVKNHPRESVEAIYKKIRG